MSWLATSRSREPNTDLFLETMGGVRRGRERYGRLENCPIAEVLLMQQSNVCCAGRGLSAATPSNALGGRQFLIGRERVCAYKAVFCGGSKGRGMPMRACLPAWGKVRCV
jgi:hypothetical protein